MIVRFNDIFVKKYLYNKKKSHKCVLFNHSRCTLMLTKMIIFYTVAKTTEMNKSEAELKNIVVQINTDPKIFLACVPSEGRQRRRRFTGLPLNSSSNHPNCFLSY